MSGERAGSPAMRMEWEGSSEAASSPLALGPMPAQVPRWPLGPEEHSQATDNGFPKPAIGLEKYS